MPRKRFTNEQIAFVLRRAENGATVDEVCRKMGVSEPTFYRWKKQFVGIGVPEVRRLKQLEDGTTSSSGWWPTSRLTAPCWRMCLSGSGEARCSPQRYRKRADPQVTLRMRLKEFTAARVRYGYRRLHILLRRKGWEANHKHTYRIYRDEGLSIRPKLPKRKRAWRYRQGWPAIGGPNEVRAMDFMSDRLFDGRPLRILTVVDCHTQESLSLTPKTNFRAFQVSKTLDALVKLHGRPSSIRVDNGPEFIRRMLDQWDYLNGVDIDF